MIPEPGAAPAGWRRWPLAAGRWLARRLALPRSASREAFVLWALCFGAIVALSPAGPTWAKVAGTLGFIYLPLWAMGRRGEDLPDYGLTLRSWRADLRLALAVAAVLFPLFIGGYVAFSALLPRLPEQWLRVLTPYVAAPSFHWRLPDRFGEYALDHLFVVALPEELFYRGYLQTRLRDAFPRGRVWWGARLGPAFWITAALFAVGHLAVFEVWRLAVFFPALVFGWMRERTGSVLGAALVHGTANLLVMVLDACFFGR